jgi:hypothetical protein
VQIIECPSNRRNSKLSGLVPIAVAFSLRVALVGFGAQMGRHLGFEYRLNNPFHNEPEKVRVVGQNGLRRCCHAGTLSVGHRLPPSIRFIALPIVEDDGLPDEPSSNYRNFRTQPRPTTKADD